MGGDLTFPSAVKVMGMNPVTGLPDYDDNGHLVVAGTPFTGDITFNGDIAKIANVAISYAATGTAGKMPIVFFDATGVPFGTNSNPVIVQSPTGGTNVNITDILGDEVQSNGTAITVGQPAVQTLGVMYGTRVSDSSSLPIVAGQFITDGIANDAFLLGVGAYAFAYNPTGDNGQTLYAESPLVAYDTSAIAQELAVAGNIKAVGGVVQAPAMSAYNDGLDPASTVMPVASQGMGFSIPDQFGYSFTGSYAGQTGGWTASDAFAQDSALIFWGPGGTAVAPPVNIYSESWDLVDGEMAPRVIAVSALVSHDYTTLTSQTYTGLGAGSIQAGDVSNEGWGGAAVSAAQDFTGFNVDLSSPLFTPIVNAGLSAISHDGTTLSALSMTQVASGGGFVSALDVNTATLKSTDTYNTDTETTHTFTAGTFTWQTTSDDPASIGLAYTATLERSIDGGTTWDVIGTKTVADVTAAPTTVTGKLTDQYKTKMASLVLGATATNVKVITLAGPN